MRSYSLEAPAAARPNRLQRIVLRSRTRQITLDDRYLFTRQLHVLQRAGIPILSSLQALEAQLSSPAIKSILRDLHRDLLDGKTLSQALSRHSETFGLVYLSLVQVGEAGGLLEDSLDQLARLLEWEIELRNRLREALQYPIIVMLTMTAALTVMMVFVLPRFTDMFTSFRIKLPLQTRLLIGLSYVLAHYGWLILCLLLGAAVGWWRYLQTDRGLLRWHTWKIHLPGIGPIFLQHAMSRFARITAALNHSGVPILETLSLAGLSVSNRYVRQRLDAVRHQVKDGGALASAMKAESVFPAMVTQMVATGEETGRLDELLRNVSEYYDHEVTFAAKRLITWLEPTLLLVVSLGVLLMATAVFVPMWDMVKVFKQH